MSVLLYYGIIIESFNPEKIIIMSKKASTPAKKEPAQKTPAKKATVKTEPAKKTAATKETAKKVTATKAPAAKVTADKAAKPKATAKKESGKKEASKKSDKKSAKVVKAKSDAAGSLRDLLIDGLKDLYWAENKLLKGLNKMHANATSAKLQEYITQHHAETKEHISRLEKVFETMGEKAEGAKCEAMAGLLKEGESILEETKPGAVRDAGIILASQKIEHYEISSYGTLAMFAKQLGESEAEKILRDTLNEEKATNNILTNLAVNEINTKAEK